MIAKCSFSSCTNKAEWAIGTWQCCDKCAEKWVTKTDDNWGYTVYGTCSRIGQDIILEHNLKYNLKHCLIN